jgi:hypothetical protein
MDSTSPASRTKAAVRGLRSANVVVEPMTQAEFARFPFEGD